MSNGIPSFRVFASSRQPVRGRDYDPNDNIYRVEYLNERNYTLTINAFPGADVIRTVPRGPGVPKPIIIKRLRVPSDTVAFDFAVRSSDGKFERTASKPVATTGVINEGRPNQAWDWEVDVPGDAIYHISVRLRNESGDGPKNTTVMTLPDHLVVCLGDSFASGEGNPDRAGRVDRTGHAVCSATTASLKFDSKPDMETEASWLEPRAHRSLRSGHARGSDSAGITFVTFATSGAKIKEGLLEAQHPSWQDVGQIEEARRTVGDRSIDALLLSIGGNDIGFADGLRDLASDWRDGGLDKMVRETRQRIEDLEGKFASLAPRLESLVDPRRVFITEYPAGLFDKKDLLGGPLGRRAEGCEVFDTTVFMKVTAVDAAMIFELAHRLNDQIRSAADSHGWTYIDGIVEGFAGHGYCDVDTFWVGAETSCRTQGDFNGTMHPNNRGHGVYAQHIANALRQHFMIRDHRGPNREETDEPSIRDHRGPGREDLG